MQTPSPKKYKYGIMLALKSIILIFSVTTFILCLFLKYKEALFPERGNIVLALLYFMILLTMSVTYGCFRIGKVRLKELNFSFFISQFLTNFFSYFILSLIGKKMLNPIWILALTFVQFLFGVLVYIVANSLYTILFSARDALLVYSGCEYDSVVLRKLNSQYKRFNIKRVVNENYSAEEIQLMALDYSTMIIGNIDASLKAKLIKYCFAKKIQLYIIPSIEDIVLHAAHYTNVYDTLLLFSRNQALTIEQQVVKRAIDLLVSIVMLIIASPLMLLTALLIKLYDGGSVFFKQKRYTLDGKVFTLIKFRSMIMEAEKDGAQYTVNNDPRITPIGRIIRALRIDELPQLINILKGEMSLVGPRAERVENADKYASMMPEFIYRLKVKAGLTGYAQLYGKYNTSFEDKARMDIDYIVNYSLLLDLKLMFYTLKIIFTRESTDGFDENANEKPKLNNDSVAENENR